MIRFVESLVRSEHYLSAVTESSRIGEKRALVCAHRASWKPPIDRPIPFCNDPISTAADQTAEFA
jgi:hypothetical protein